MSYIEEAGTISDIVSSIVDFGTKVGSKILNSKNQRSNVHLDRSSISRATKDLVASFPVLCDDSISSGTAAMITKAVERNCLVMLQMLFSSVYLRGDNAREVLAKWHNNMDTDYGMDELLDLIATFESAKDYESIEFKQILREFAPIFQQYLQDQKSYPLSSFSENSISSYEVDLTAMGELNVRQIHEDYFGDKYIDNLDQANAKARFDQLAYNQQAGLAGIIGGRNRDRNQASFNRAKVAQDALNYELNKQKFAYQIDKDKQARDDSIEDRDYQRMIQDRKYALDLAQQRQGYLTKQLLPSDVKKVNELVPSMLILQFDGVNFDDAGNPIDTNYRVLKQSVVGVKARLIPCDSYEIIDHVRSIEKTKISLLNLFRATTKEISFAKDFIGAVDQAKIEAKQNSKLSKTSPIWRALQNRANKSTMNRVIKKNRANDAGAITTLVVSAESADLLKKAYDIDLSLPSKAKYIMEQYNLLCLILVNEQTQVARFLFDGEKYYQDYSFDMLERETGDGSYKKIVNLLSTINRG